MFWKNSKGIARSAHGASGGIGTLWKNASFELVQSTSHTHWILSILHHKESGSQVSILNVYVLALLSEKKRRIQESLASQRPVNLILAGDLNITLSTKEKRGGSIVRDPLRENVEDIMRDWDLEDVKPAQGLYTWTNRRTGPGHIAARLDRFLVQQSFFVLGFRSDSSILAFIISDH